MKSVCHVSVGAIECFFFLCSFCCSGSPLGVPVAGCSSPPAAAGAAATDLPVVDLSSQAVQSAGGPFIGAAVFVEESLGD
jgi:hypothetical protein